MAEVEKCIRGERHGRFGLLKKTLPKIDLHIFPAAYLAAERRDQSNVFVQIDASQISLYITEIPLEPQLWSAAGALGSIPDHIQSPTSAE